jgi:dihydrofolate reductase
MVMQNQMQKRKLLKIKYTAYVASSIDGRIAKDRNSGTDWTSKEDWNFFQNELTKMDAVIVGHNTFKVSESRLRKRNTIVLTSKISHLKTEGTIIFFNPKKASLKKFLESKNYKKVAILGGSKVYDFCLRNKIIDELFVTIEPYIFTAGVPMFAGVDFKKYKFVLESIKKFNKKGTILLKYKNAN